jgi:hypothetical protein
MAAIPIAPSKIRPPIHERHGRESIRIVRMGVPLRRGAVFTIVLSRRHLARRLTPRDVSLMKS